MAKFEERMLVEMVLYILNKTGGTDFYHVFKILYFAEVKHLAKWGRSIIVLLIMDQYHLVCMML